MSPRAWKLLHIFSVSLTVPMLIPVILPMMVPVSDNTTNIKFESALQEQFVSHKQLISS